MKYKHISRIHCDFENYVISGTNINDALVQGLSYLEQQEEKKPHGEDTRTSMIIFLTDGQPTTGITNNPQIISNAKSANTRKPKFAYPN